eukprot:jgi/Mesvir1/27528/Mv07289-RA.1
MPELQALIQSAAGKPLYLAYGKADPPGMQDFLDAYGARSYVGEVPFQCGIEICQFVSRVGFRHMLVNNAATLFPQGWELMHGVVSGVVGQDYDFSPRLEWPVCRPRRPDQPHGGVGTVCGAREYTLCPGELL